MGNRLQKILQYWLVPKKFFALADTVAPALWILGILLLCYGAIAAFLAPADYQQGNAFKIMYIHVPCAVLSLMVYTLIAVCSFLNTVWRLKVAQVISLSSVPIGTFLTVATLFTGAVWGKPMWGTWWAWDARLTSELLLLFLYIGYIALYAAMDNKEVAIRACNILAMVGFLDIPIIHFSVVWWNTLHQGATLFKLSAPSISSVMFYPLIGTGLGLAFITAAYIMHRAKYELMDLEWDNKWVENRLHYETKKLNGNM